MQILRFQSPLLNSCSAVEQYYSTLATQLINAHYNDLNEVHIINQRNNGAVKDWPADWVLELPCNVNAEGFTPLPTSPLPSRMFWSDDTDQNV